MRGGSAVGSVVDVGTTIDCGTAVGSGALVGCGLAVGLGIDVGIAVGDGAFVRGGMFVGSGVAVAGANVAIIFGAMVGATACCTGRRLPSAEPMQLRTINPIRPIASLPRQPVFQSCVIFCIVSSW